MWRKHSRTPMDADGYNWRKYGCRVNVAFDARTTYFKCATPGCGAKKRMVTSLHTCRTTGAIMDGETVHVHDGNHTHAPHAPHARSSNRCVSALDLSIMMERDSRIGNTTIG